MLRRFAYNKNLTIYVHTRLTLKNLSSSLGRGETDGRGFLYRKKATMDVRFIVIQDIIFELRANP